MTERSCTCSTQAEEHLGTVDALTGARRHSFAYDGQGRLIAVTAGADSEEHHYDPTDR